MNDILGLVAPLTLRVVNGSGVLVSPAEGSYAYIITAKHNLVSDDNTGGYLKLSDVNVRTVLGQEIKVVDQMIHPDLDIAILVTSTRIESPILISQEINVGSNVYVVGYPELRQGEVENDQLRDFRGTVDRLNKNFNVISLESRPDITELRGVSGGGLFRERDGKPVLCGIQSQVDGVANDEHHGKVRCIPIKYVEEILSSNLNAHGYSPVYPAHFTCFSHSERHIFPLESVQTPASVEYLKAVLKAIASELRSNSLPKPQEIYERYQALLLINNSPSEDIFHPLLWATYLEFLVVASIIDVTKQLDFSYLENSHSKRRFLFSATSENWTSLLRDIYTADFRGLAKGGVIVVSTLDSKTPSHTLTRLKLDKVIADIGRRQFGPMLIDSPMKNPAHEFKLFHWSGLHYQCIVSKEDDYSEFFDGKPGAGYDDLLEKIKREYNAFI